MSDVGRASPYGLLWLDTETSGLLPEEDLILEAAWTLTGFAYPFKEIAKGHVIIPHTKRRVRSRLSSNPVVTRMHEESGLLADLRAIWEERMKRWYAHGEPTIPGSNIALADSEHADTVVTRETLEKPLLELSNDWPLDKDARVVLAGSSVHFDLAFLRVWCPEFAKRLSHRTYDASVLSLACSSLGRPREERAAAVHRAQADVEGSLRIAREAIEWIRGDTISRYSAEDA